MPVIGDLRLDGDGAIRPRHIRALVDELRRSDLAPRTQLHVYNTLKTMFTRAVRDEVLASNPCNLDKTELPKKVDADPEWRARAVFSRVEVEHLITDPEVAEVRRLIYALVFLTGARIGEVIALRWSDIHERAPLDMLLIAKSYDTKKKRIGPPKTRTGREVPIHPTMAKLLVRWREVGWPSTFGRTAKADDLIVPYPLTRGRGRRIGGPTTCWSADTFRKRCYEDCARFTWRKRAPHDGRSTFISLTTEDGCSPILERVTHAPQQTVRAGYTRPTWAALCAEMMKYRILESRVRQADTGTALTAAQVSEEIEGENGAGGNRSFEISTSPAEHSMARFNREQKLAFIKTIEAALAAVRAGGSQLVEDILRSLLAEVWRMPVGADSTTNVVELRRSEGS